MSRSISVRSRRTSVPSRSKGSISCRMPPTSSAVGLAQAFQLLVDDHGADAVVREDLQQQRAVGGEGQDVRALDAACAGLDAVLQVEGRCRWAGSAPAARPAAARRRPARARCRWRCRRSSAFSRMPGISVMNSSLSACSAMAVAVATSSIVRLKASPVGEKPKGLSSTSAPESMARRIATCVDRAHQAAVHEVDAVDDAHRPRGEEVARDHAHGGVGHRRIRQTLRERGLDLEAQLAGSFLGAIQRHVVGDAHAVAAKRETWPLAASCSLTCGRKPCTSTSLMPIACRMARSCTKAVELARGDGLAGQADDEGLAAVGVDVRRHGAKPGHEGVRENEAHAARDCAAAWLTLTPVPATRRKETDDGRLQDPRRFQLDRADDRRPRGGRRVLRRAVRLDASRRWTWAAGPYHVLKVGETAVGGIMGQAARAPARCRRPGAATSRWTKSTTTVAKCHGLGGKVVVPAMDVPGVGRMAVIQDPQGAALSVITYSAARPAAATRARIIRGP